MNTFAEFRYHFRWPSLAAALLLLTTCPVVIAGDELQANAAASSAAEVDFFEKRIRPVLVKHCYQCHSSRAEQLKGGLILENRASILRGGDSGPALVPYQAEDSLLLAALRYDEDSYQMPPSGQLPQAVVADFEKWIAMGAPDPRSGQAKVVAGQMDFASARQHWAFQPPRQAPRPPTEDRSWPRSALDGYILARLEQNGIAPSREADRRTLIRRVYYDLIGLPPTFAQVQAFVSDPSPQAFENVVDRLLASPHFGQRWARHWMDLARFADTKGYVFREDRNYPKAHTYRDWLIEALNEDLPYDRFLMYQIAADQLTADQDYGPLAAMGFLTLGRRFLNNQHDIIDDRIDVVTRTTMALTVTCARCHDHKYDPIPTGDYYSLYGVFASSREPKDDPSPLRLVDAPTAHNARVFLRGNPANPGPEVPRQFLRILAGKDRKPFQHGSGRLELAQAIASRDNPLTARVFVNRVWGHLFGQGLVLTPSDFGLRSDPPIHRDVLDHLALQFMDDGWSIKRLIRHVVLSSVYRQLSDDRDAPRQIDPENRLLWKMNRRRLDFEALRDSLLAVSGQLDTTLGGPSVQIASSPYSERRTMYAFIDRQNLPALFRTFDFAVPDTHAPKRANTTVPQQALFLLNNPFVQQQAEHLVRRCEAAGPRDNAARIVTLYQLVYARAPTAEERSLGKRFLEQGGQTPQTVRTDRDFHGPLRPPLDIWQRYAQALLLANEFVFLD